jgi:hypothetical protein
MIVNDTLTDASFHLIEQVANTTLGTNVTAGSFTVTPPSMNAIYLGAMLIVDTGVAQEIVTTTVVTATTFTATFVNAHASTAPLFAATFPSGQTTHPLWTQQEMINYTADIQLDFLLKTRPIYEVVTQAIDAGVRFYTQPSNTIRIERIAVNGNELYNTAQETIDLLNASGTTLANVPRYWFQDEQPGNYMYGYKEVPQVNNTAELWYSEASSSTLVLTSTLLVPDYLSQYIKYGVLARAFQKDGEYRDPQRAEYFEKRYDLGVQLTIRLLEGMGTMLGQVQQRTPSSFSPMAVPQQATGQ